MTFKERFYKIKEKCADFSERHKKSLNFVSWVLWAVLIFVAFMWVVERIDPSSRPKSYTASASSIATPAPAQTYAIETYYNPQVYVSWSNNGSYTTLMYAPTLFISSTGYYVTFGGSVYSLNQNTSSGFNVQTWQVQGQNPSVVSGYDIFIYGQLQSYNVSPSLFYSRLIEGQYVISRVEFTNFVSYNLGSPKNEFYYYVYYRFNGSEYLGITYRFWRGENPPPSLSALNVSSRNDVNASKIIEFSYYITYNGLNTSSAEYQAGYDAGSNLSQTTAYNNGYSAGEVAGYQAGLNETLSSVTPWDVIVDGVSSFFSVEIFPNVKIGSVFTVVFGALLLGFLFRIILGH